MKYQPNIKLMVCKSCGLALSRHELDQYWQKIRHQNVSETDEVQQKKNRRKDWLEWYSSSKSDKEQY